MKANPENLAKAITGTLQNEDNERVFQLSDFLTPQQVASYFCRLAVPANWIEDPCKRNHLQLLQG